MHFLKPSHKGSFLCSLQCTGSLRVGARSREKTKEYTEGIKHIKHTQPFSFLKKDLHFFVSSLQTRTFYLGNDRMLQIICFQFLNCVALRLIILIDFPGFN